MTLIEKITNLTWFDLINKLKSIYADLYNNSLTNIQSVTGTAVDETDPLNPVIDIPTLQEVTDAGSSTINTIRVGGLLGANTIVDPQFVSVKEGGGLRRGTVGRFALEIASNAEGVAGLIKSDNLSGDDKSYQLPNNSGTIAIITQEISDGDTVNSPSGDILFDTFATKQATLVSGTNIKTINGESIIGSGDLEILSSATEIRQVNTTGTFNTTVNTWLSWSRLGDNILSGLPNRDYGTGTFPVL